MGVYFWRLIERHNSQYNEKPLLVLEKKLSFQGESLGEAY